MDNIMRISWIDQDERGYLNVITIHKNFIEYDISDKDGNSITGEEWEISSELADKLKELFTNQNKLTVLELP